MHSKRAAVGTRLNYDIIGHLQHFKVLIVTGANTLAVQNIHYYHTDCSVPTFEVYVLQPTLKTIRKLEGANTVERTNDQQLFFPLMIFPCYI